jgi:hypothetical protein
MDPWPPGTPIADWVIERKLGEGGKEIDLAQPTTGSTLEVRVSKARNGQPLAGATVTISNGCDTSSGTTDANGELKFATVPAGTNTVQVRKPPSRFASPTTAPNRRPRRHR